MGLSIYVDTPKILCLKADIKTQCVLEHSARWDKIALIQGHPVCGSHLYRPSETWVLLLSTFMPTLFLSPGPVDASHQYVSLQPGLGLVGYDSSNTRTPPLFKNTAVFPLPRLHCRASLRCSSFQKLFESLFYSHHLYLLHVLFPTTVVGLRQARPKSPWLSGHWNRCFLMFLVLLTPFTEVS